MKILKILNASDKVKNSTQNEIKVRALVREAQTYLFERESKADELTSKIMELQNITLKTDNNWFKQIVELEQELQIVKAELVIAKEVYSEYFSS